MESIERATWVRLFVCSGVALRRNAHWASAVVAMTNVAAANAHHPWIEWNCMSSPFDDERILSATTQRRYDSNDRAGLADSLEEFAARAISLLDQSGSWVQGRKKQPMLGTEPDKRFKDLDENRQDLSTDLILVLLSILELESKGFEVLGNEPVGLTGPC
jgi:hypothetical protein